MENPALYPDRLVAFLAELIAQVGREKVQELVNYATEANLTAADESLILVVPEGERDPDSVALMLHTWAYALTGASAKARNAVSQLSDGETRGFINVGPDQVSDLVAEVADRLAREQAARE